MNRNKNDVGGIYYKRSYFRTRLPEDARYTRSHFWLKPLGQDLWQIGLTKFAVRMLGEIVEYGFEVQPGDALETGQIIGWIEGFKAISDIYCVVDGTFEKENEILQERPDEIFRRPYNAGWLYMARGKAESDALNVHEYIRFLDRTIDDLRDV